MPLLIDFSFAPFSKVAAAQIPRKSRRFWRHAAHRTQLSIPLRALSLEWQQSWKAAARQTQRSLNKVITGRERVCYVLAVRLT